MADTITNIIGKNVKLKDNGDGTYSLAVSIADTEINVAVNVDDIITAKQATHDDFNCNSNVQINNVDVSNVNPMPVAIGSSIPSGTNNIGKTGYTLKKSSTSFVRPSDTTTYTVGDAVTNSTSAPTVFELDMASIGAVAGQSLEIRKIAIISNAKQALLPLFNVYLSSTTFTATNDNSALSIDDTTMEAGGAWFNCDIQNSTALNSRVAQMNVNAPMVLAPADTKFYGAIQANNAYVPVSGEKFTIIAWVALL